MPTVNKEVLVEMARIAQQSERYDDMAQAMKLVTETGVELSILERNLLTTAYKNVIDARRSSWRAISSIEKNPEASAGTKQLASEYRQRVEQEIVEICYEVLRLLDKYLLLKASNLDSKVFYLKTKGDYYRYLAEATTGDARKTAVGNSQTAYQDAFEISKAKMQPSNPMRLGVALSFSVFYHEILNSPDKACKLSKQAYEDAVVEMHSLNEELCKESTPIMQLLKDNLTILTSDKQEDGDDKQEGGDN